MGAGVSTEGGEMALGENVAQEGYDSELEAEMNEDYEREERPCQGEVMRETFGGRLSLEPKGGMKPFPCAGKIVPPPGYETLASATSAPDNTLQLEFVHGYRGHDARNNLHYNQDGEVVYHCAAVGVVMDTRQAEDQGEAAQGGRGKKVMRQQRFFQQHDDDVLCLAMHPDRDIVATGQVGVCPEILVWRSSDCTLLARIKGFHTVAIVALAFSPDGRYIGCVGKDSNHSVAIYEWAANPTPTQEGTQPSNGSAGRAEGEGASAAEEGPEEVSAEPPHAGGGPGGGGGEGRVWEGRLLATAQGDVRRVFCCAFSPEGRFVTGGEFHLRFYSLDATVDGWDLVGVDAEYAHRARRGYAASTVLCLCFTPERCTFAGTKGGCVYKFEEAGVKALRKYEQVHQGPVSEIVYSPGGHYIITGGKDGKVRFHSAFMQFLFEINLCKAAESMVDDHCNPVSFCTGRAPYIRALCHDHDRHKLVVGVSCSEVFEFDVSTRDSFKRPLGRRLLIHGHASHITKAGSGPGAGGGGPVLAGEVWALDPHPFNATFATAGDDKSVRIWDCTEHRLLSMRKIKGRARAVSWHPRGAHLAVGCSHGQLYVMNAATGHIDSFHNLQHSIRQLRYSPTGKFLAAACGPAVLVFDTLKGVNGEYVTVEDCTGLASDAVHFDWSTCGKFLRVNCFIGGLYCFTMPDGDPCDFQAGSPASAAEWATSTCLASWECQGVWPMAAQTFEDINACCRSRRGDWREDECVLATADDTGAIKLFPYPADVGRASCNEYAGHSSQATNLGFTYNDKYLITVGGADRCVFQWRHLEGGECPGDESDDEDNLVHDGGKANKQIVMVQTGMAAGESEFEPVNATDGIPNPYKNHSLAELMAKRGYKAPITGRPCMGQMHVPSGFEVGEDTYDQSRQTLKLSWVQGYRGWDTRQNLYYTLGDQVAYHAAAIGICFDPKSNTQRFLTDDPESEGIAEGNTDDILCMARHPNKVTFATGEIGLKPKIIIWDSGTMERSKMLQGFHKRAVVALCFSPNEGTYLASVGQDNDHSVAVYNWAKEELLATFSGDQNPVLSIAWSPFDNTLVTTGVKHIKFVLEAFSASKPIKKGWRVRPKKGLIGKKGKIQNLYSCGFLAKGRTAVGTRGGELYVFDKANLTEVVKAHKSKVCALHVVNDVLITGGDDGVIKLWNTASLTCLHEVIIPCGVGEESCCIRSVFADHSDSVLVGTKGGSVFEVKEAGQPNLLISSHAQGELWGLAVNPDGTHVTTSSDDGTLRTWDMSCHKQVAIKQLVLRPQPVGTSTFTTAAIRTVAYSPDGNTLAAGMIDGKVYLLRAGTLDVLYVLETRALWVSDIKWSPSGRLLAVGTHDSFVDIYECDRGYKLVGSCKGHSSFVSHIGWSQDETTLFSNSGDYELLFWEAPGGKRIQHSSNCKDTTWNAYTGILGWPVLGIWHKGADGTDVNTCDRIPSQDCLATGDDRGLVSLYKYPALGGKARVYGGHSSHVTTVRFSPDGTKLYSAGGGDACLCEWKVV